MLHSRKAWQPSGMAFSLRHSVLIKPGCKGSLFLCGSCNGHQKLLCKHDQLLDGAARVLGALGNSTDEQHLYALNVYECCMPQHQSN